MKVKYCDKIHSVFDERGFGSTKEYLILIDYVMQWVNVNQTDACITEKEVYELSLEELKQLIREEIKNHLLIERGTI